MTKQAWVFCGSDCIPHAFLPSNFVYYGGWAKDISAIGTMQQVAEPSKLACAGFRTRDAEVGNLK